MYIYQWEIPMYVEDEVHQWSCEESGLTLRHDQLVDTSACPMISFFADLLTPKDEGIFILKSLTNISHQVNLFSLRGSCLFFNILCKMKPGDKC